jgi:hypothetical protein
MMIEMRGIVQMRVERYLINMNGTALRKVMWMEGPEYGKGWCHNKRREFFKKLLYN